MTVTVFTCTVGKTDPVRPPTVKTHNVRYVCFSDRPSSPSPYEHVPVPTQADLSSERLLSRQLKIRADMPELGESDVSLWHDAAYQLKSNPIDVAIRHLTDDLDMVAFKHPHRSLIEDEAVAIDKWKYVPLEQMRDQVKTYRTAGFVKQTAITSTGFCLRRTTPDVAVFNQLWWQEVARWGWRDQMSVDYAIWKTGIRVGYLPGHYRDNPYATWFKN